MALSPQLRNQKASSMEWLDGVGAPSEAEVGEANVERIVPIEDGMFIVSTTTLFVPWGRIISVQFDSVLV